MIVDVVCVHSVIKIITRAKSDRRIYFVMQGYGLFDRAGIKLLKGLGYKLIPLEYELKPTEKGNHYFEVHRDLDNFYKNWIEPKVRKEILENGYFSEYEKSRLLQHLALLNKKKLYRSIEIVHIMGLCEEKMAGQKSVLLMDSIWKEELTGFYKQNGVDVIFYRIFVPYFYKLQARKHYYMDLLVKESFKKKKSAVCKTMFIAYKLAKEITKSLFYWILRIFNKSLPRNIGEFDIALSCPVANRNEWFNDLCWKDRSSESPSVLAILYGQMDSRAYGSFGYLAEKWISLDRSIYSKYSKNIFCAYYWLWPVYPKILIANIKNLVRSFLRTKAPAYHWFEIINLWIELSRMKALFLMAGVKLYMTNIEGLDEPGLGATLAINQLKGLSLGGTWSIHGFLNFLIKKNRLDIYFAWGEQHFDMLKEELSMAMIISGYPGDYYLGKAIKKAELLRQEWKLKYNAKLVFCYYDNLTANDIHHSFSSTVQYLRNILNWIKENQEVLLVVKSKRKQMYLAYPDFIKELMDGLEKNGQIIYMYEKGDLAPGLASDIVLGIGVGTLPLLCGTYGKKTVLLDSQRIYREIPVSLENVEFIEGPELITHYLDECQNNNEDQECIKVPMMAKPNRLDSYVDGEANRRISAYVSELVLDLQKGFPRDKAIEKANREYAQRWGENNVIELGRLDRR